MKDETKRWVEAGRILQVNPLEMVCALNANLIF
jgi:hypothetical protein